MRHVTTEFGPRLLRSLRRPATLGKHHGNELGRVYFARAMRVKRLARGKEGDADAATDSLQKLG